MHTNLIDYIIIAILFFGAITGFQQGFFSSLGRMASAILAICAAFIYGNDFLIFLDNKFDIISNLSDIIRQKILVFAVKEEVTFLSHIVQQNILNDSVEQLTRFIFGPIAFIILLLVCHGIFSLLFSSVNRLVSWGFLGVINRVMGMVIVMIKNLIIVTVIIGIIMPSLEFAAGLDIIGAVTMEQCLKNSLLVSYLAVIYENMRNVIDVYV